LTDESPATNLGAVSSSVIQNINGLKTNFYRMDAKKPITGGSK
jgi:hypothetical protein